MYKTNMLIPCSIACFTCLPFYFSGGIADRDFTPGVSVLDNIVEAIHSSYKIILVLTDQFVSSQWCKYETDQAIIRSLRLTNSSCVIPVLLEDCEIPFRLYRLHTLLSVSLDCQPLIVPFGFL